jgi:hypothetical protein
MILRSDTTAAAIHHHRRLAGTLANQTTRLGFQFCYLPLELVRALFSSKAGMLNGFYMHMRNALNLESTTYIWSYMAILISFF